MRSMAPRTRSSAFSSSERFSSSARSVDIEQRQRAAHDLLRAAVRIAVEGLEQPRHVEARERRDRDRDGPGAARISATRSFERVRLAPGAMRLHSPACQALRSRAGWRRRSSASARRRLGPCRVTSIVAVPWPPAVTGMVMPSLGLGLEPDGGAQRIRRDEDRDRGCRDRPCSRPPGPPHCRSA